MSHLGSLWLWHEGEVHPWLPIRDGLATAIGSASKGPCHLRHALERGHQRPHKDEVAPRAEIVEAPASAVAVREAFGSAFGKNR